MNVGNDCWVSGRKKRVEKGREDDKRHTWIHTCREASSDVEGRG